MKTDTENNTVKKLRNAFLGRAKTRRSAGPSWPKRMILTGFPMMVTAAILLPGTVAPSGQPPGMIYSILLAALAIGSLLFVCGLFLGIVSLVMRMLSGKD